MLMKKSSYFLVFAAIALVCFVRSSIAALSCLDEDGKPVDWFIGYKFPKLDGNDLFKSGVAYSYITSEDVKGADGVESLNSQDEDPRSMWELTRDLLLKYAGFTNRRGTRSSPKKKKIVRRNQVKTGWIASNNSVASPESILMQTLAVAYDTKQGQSISSVFYNDDPIGTSDDSSNQNQNSQRAHAKGVLMMDNKSDDGVLLTHSIPKFPKVRSIDNEYPYTGEKKGQTFMCISFHMKESGKKIVDHLVKMSPLVYDSRISDELYKQFPALKFLAVDGKKKRFPSDVSPKLLQDITTKGGHALRIFSKSTKFNQDLYDGWIDQEIGSDLFVETWRLGSGNPLNSSCPMHKHHINNVLSLKYDSSIQWEYTKDHSKWAISEQEDIGVVCLGDSNRMESQFKRGGGAVCIKCPTCWTIFSKTIQDFEPCPLTRGKKRG